MSFFRSLLLLTLFCFAYAGADEKPEKKVSASKKQTGKKSDAGLPPTDDGRNPRIKNKKDGKNTDTGKPEPKRDPALAGFGIYAADAPNPGKVEPVETLLPLKLNKGDRIAFIGNTLFDRAQEFAFFESYLHLQHPEHDLFIRNFAWS
ncbi:MAG: hypothetical protein MI807_24290, partial [Verrucomicrobiales bacterium]|nr:hypothetical protein [Verrucomicrobiales bacterium]